MRASTATGSLVPYKTLIIVESPSKCKTIEHILGPAYMCVATCGHIRDLAIKPDLSNVPEILSSERIPYTKSSKKMNNIRMIQTAISKCNGTVILATDADREGESIAWHVCQLFGLPVETTPRIVFKEITKTAIQNAIQNPMRINMNLVHAQQTRQILDFIIGYGVTPLLWTWMKTTTSAAIGIYKPNKNTNTNKPTKLIQSAGRCQSPALRIMQEAHDEMQAAALNPVVKYKCVAHFTKYNMPFVMNTRLNPEEVDTFLYFYTDTVTRQRVASSHTFGISDPKPVAYKAPLPLKSTTLQQVGSTYIKLTPSETMDVAQRLYESGYITYHRTDSTCLSEEFKTAAHAFIQSNWNASYISESKTSASNKRAHAADHAHEAIRPVNIIVTSLPDDQFGKAEQLLYSFIWTRAVCSCMCDSVYDKLTATVSVHVKNDDGCDSKVPKNAIAAATATATYTYVYNAYRQKIAGWRACIARYGMKTLQLSSSSSTENGGDGDQDDGDQELDNSKLPNFQAPQYSSDHFTYLQSIVPGSELPYNSIDCFPIITNAVVPYTYTRLVHRLEKMGIGRPSTFASIIHTLKKREYICEASSASSNKPSTAASKPQSQEQYKYKRYKITNSPASTISDTVDLVSSPSTKSNPNQIQITDYGQSIIRALFPTCEDLFAYDYTKEMEETLDEVARGAHHWVDVCKRCMSQVNKLKQCDADVPSAPLELEAAPSIPGVIRKINEHASIREGKYGAYIYYRTPAMKKPKFIPLKGFPYSYTECDHVLLADWIDKFT